MRTFFVCFSNSYYAQLPRHPWSKKNWVFTLTTNYKNTYVIGKNFTSPNYFVVRMKNTVIILAADENRASVTINISITNMMVLG